MAATYSSPRRGSKRSARGTRRTGGNEATPTGRSKVRSTNHQEAKPCEQLSPGATRQSSGQRHIPSDSQSLKVSGSGGDQPLFRSNHTWVRRIASAAPIATTCRIGVPVRPVRETRQRRSTCSSPSLPRERPFALSDSRGHPWRDWPAALNLWATEAVRCDPEPLFRVEGSRIRSRSARSSLRRRPARTARRREWDA